MSHVTTGDQGVGNAVGRVGTPTWGNGGSPGACWLRYIEAACGDRFAVATDVDLRLRDVPLLNRLPDVAVYDASLPDDEVLRPSHCALVIEVMSPGSVTTDKADKPAEYAAGIRHFWRVEQDSGTGELCVFCYRLTTTGGPYASAEVATGMLSVDDPFSLSIDLADLLQGS
ncbi:MAG TPA: Uma2 family endonuclease [Streptosporangiaceae bacterium]|nr:Uma2 family endonuclease [Streptosporangiaceae bacterium]